MHLQRVVPYFENVDLITKNFSTFNLTIKVKKKKNSEDEQELDEKKFENLKINLTYLYLEHNVDKMIEHKIMKMEKQHT